MINVTIALPDELDHAISFISKELKQPRDHILYTAIKHYVNELIEDIKAYKEIMKDQKQTDASGYIAEIENEYGLNQERKT